jgi:2-keto-4-pentenoate hydratase
MLGTKPRSQRMSEIERVAQVLREAEAATTAVGPVSDSLAGGLTLESAHLVCEANVARREAAGETIAGFKIGFANVALREMTGLPDSTYGYLMHGMVLETGAVIGADELIAPRIETEICLRLGRDLAGPGTTAADVLDSTDGVRASFEICDARIRDWKCPYPDIFADNSFSGRIVLGGAGWLPLDAMDLLNETVVLAKDGVPLAEGRGELAMGNPAHAVAWLANMLVERGRGLKAGMIIMTGSLTAITPMQRGSVYRGTFSTLGVVETTLA